jgi:Swiss Army Knife protein, DSP-PTPase phosphatase domain
MGTAGLFLRRLRALVDDRPTGFLWVEQGRLGASGFPASRAQVEWLRRAGVRSVLTLTEYPIPTGFLAGTGIETLHVPMQDHQPPSQESLERAAGYIKTQVGSGKPILVHCLAGKGRTMCAIAAFLMETQGVGAKAAMDRLRSIRTGAVERGQEESLFAFEKALGRGLDRR